MCNQNLVFRGNENLLEVSLQKKKQCFNQARKIVECLLEEDVDETQLLQNVSTVLGKCVSFFPLYVFFF